MGTGRGGVQVQFMPLAQGQEFDNSLFKLYSGLVRDIKMTVSVVSPSRLPALGQARSHALVLSGKGASGASSSQDYQSWRAFDARRQ